MPNVEQAELERLQAAEEVCWTLQLMMGFGMLPIEDRSNREFLGRSMQAWCDLCVATNTMDDYFRPGLVKELVSLAFGENADHDGSFPIAVMTMVLDRLNQEGLLKKKALARKK